MSDADLLGMAKGPARQAFASEFVETWGQRGFGGLSKRDMELLVFALLRKHRPEGQGLRPYEWAGLLGITPSRVARMRLESYLRFPELSPTTPEQLLEGFFARGVTLDVTLDAKKLALVGDVRMLVEDPVIKMELEERSKGFGALVRYERNKEIVVVPLAAFLRLVDEFAADENNDALITAAARGISRDKAAAKAFKAKVDLEAFEAKDDGQKLVDFLSLLGETFVPDKPRKLIKHLRQILGFEKARRKKAAKALPAAR